MAQPSTKVDVLQVEPGASGTRTISRDSTTGGLKFIDPDHPTGVLLSDLLGLQTITNVAVLGVTPDVTTIQEAIDAAPTGGPVPVVVIPAGDYSENLTISKNIVLAALGYVYISNDGDGDTVTITQDADGVPTLVRLQGLTLVCDVDGASVVNIDGSNTFASATLTVEDTLVAGDTITINGSTLTGGSGARTSGSNNFNATLGTTTALAAEIAAAINDTSNDFASDVTASAAGADITITAASPGSAGNSITLAVATTPSGNLTLSGSTLSGGGGLGSLVGSDYIEIRDCDLRAEGVGTRQITTQTVNNVWVFGGSWRGSSSTSECMISQTASFRVSNVEWVNEIQAAYDTGNDQPSDTTAEFQFADVRRMGVLITNYIGAGGVKLYHIPEVGDITINGDRTFDAMGCQFGNALIEDTVSARLIGCTRTSLGGEGTPVVAESSLVLSSVLAGDTSTTVSFDRSQPDTTYAVLVDVPTVGITANVTSKTVDDFTVTFSDSVTGTVFYTVLRQM